VIVIGPAGRRRGRCRRTLGRHARGPTGGCHRDPTVGLLPNKACLTDWETGVMAPYLLGLRLDGRRVLVVGGGRVAQRRIPAMLAAGASVTLVSPSVTPALDDLIAAGRVTWEPRPYQVGDCDGAWLVHACTDQRDVNTAVAAEAEAKRIWCV